MGSRVNGMIEWSDIYNPFNSIKAMAHSDRCQAIVNEDFLPPVTVDWDLVLGCNYNCPHCIWGKRRNMAPTMVPREMIQQVPSFLREWGVKGVCLSGECGDPAQHPDLPEALRLLHHNNIDVGLTTNGYALNDPFKREAAAHYCRWVGFSMDAAEHTTYSKVHGVALDVFGGVGRIILSMTDYADAHLLPVQISCKFIILPQNYSEIAQAARMAKDLGCQDFHVRPAWIPESERAKIDLNVVEEQCALAREFEDENFHVYTVTHKFTGCLEKREIKHCWASPLRSTWSADGNVIICGDRRDVVKNNVLCNYIADGLGAVRMAWNSSLHHALIDNINRNEVQDCKRCICYGYNEMIENVFVKDKMDKNVL